MELTLKGWKMPKAEDVAISLDQYLRNIRTTHASMYRKGVKPYYCSSDS